MALPVVGGGSGRGGRPVSSARSSRRTPVSDEEENESMEAAVARLNLGDCGGGVPVPFSPVKRSRMKYESGQTFDRRGVEPLRSAG